MIMMWGTYKAGKTQFIQNACEHVVHDVNPSLWKEDTRASSERSDMGLWHIPEHLTCYLFGMASVADIVQKVNVLQAFQATHLLGNLFIVASQEYNRFAEIYHGLHKVVFLNLPIVVIANFQDHPQALPPHQLRKVLNILDHIPVLPCIARDEAHVRRVLIEFFKSLPQDENIRLALDKITTQAALDLDLSQYDQRPDIEFREE